MILSRNFLSPIAKIIEYSEALGGYALYAPAVFYTVGKHGTKNSEIISRGLTYRFLLKIDCVDSSHSQRFWHNKMLQIVNDFIRIYDYRDELIPLFGIFANVLGFYAV